MVSGSRKVRFVSLLMAALMLGTAFSHSSLLLRSASAAPELVSAADTVLAWTADVTGSADVTLDGSASSEDITEYAWWLDCPATPCDESLRLTPNGDPASTEVVTVPLTVGTYNVYLWAQTGSGDWTASAPVVVTVAELEVIPVANAGPDQTVVSTNGVDAAVTMDGSGSVDAVGYGWSFELGPPFTGVNAIITLPVGTTTVTLEVTSVSGDVASDTVDITVTEVFPVADAGPDQTVPATSADGASVTMDGSGSTDAIGYGWSFAIGPPFTGVDAIIPLPIGITTVTLTVTSVSGNVDTDTVDITVTEIFPVADAGPDQTVASTNGVDADVTMDGSGSTDAVGYGWSFDIGPPFTGPNPVITLPIGLTTVNLTVTSDSGNVDSDTVDITVTTPPLLDPSATVLSWEATGTDGALVTLDGSLSSEEAGDFAWWEDCPALPCDEGIRLTEDSDDNRVADVQLGIGAHEITLWGTDAGGTFFAAAPITVTVSATAPVADAGDDQTVDATDADGALIDLDGTGSTAATGDLTYSWSVGGTEIATGAEPEPELFPIGVTVVTLTVTSVADVDDTDTVSITVNPVADAGDDQTVNSPDGEDVEVTLDGSGSIGDLETIVWTEGTDEIATGAEPDPVELAVGVHTITLTITGPGGVSDTDTVVITVTGPDAPEEATLTPVRGTVTSDVAYAISGFAAETTVLIELVPATGDPIDLGEAETDTDGAAGGTFEVPATPGGDYTVRFTAGDETAEADFEVAPRVVVAPASVRAGDTANVSLLGYSAGETVRVRWLVGSSFVEVDQATTDDTGSADVDVTVPAGVVAGPGSVRGDGTVFRAQTNAVTILPPLGPATAVLSPTRGTVNTSVSYTLTNFPASATVDITWRRMSGSLITIGTATTDATGAASGNFLVPATAGGANQQVRFASGATSVVALYEVAPRIKVLNAGAPGDVVQVSLRGFAQGETVRIRWKVGSVYVQVGTAVTSNSGSANVNVTIPANATPGNNSVRGDGTVFRAQTNVAVVTEP